MPDLTTIRRSQPLAIAAACVALLVLFPRGAQGQGFIGVTYGYNFGGDAGCPTATDCRNKNWNWGGALGTVGSIAGFELELTHAGAFTGDGPNPVAVTTLMGDIMLAPKFAIVQPYGVVGFGAIRTSADAVSGPASTTPSQSATQAGWSVGGGLLVYVQSHVGVEGTVRYYHSFQTLDLLGVNLAGGGNKVNFGRAGFGVVLKF